MQRSCAEVMGQFNAGAESAAGAGGAGRAVELVLLPPAALLHHRLPRRLHRRRDVAGAFLAALS